MITFIHQGRLLDAARYCFGVRHHLATSPRALKSRVQLRTCPFQRADVELSPTRATQGTRGHRNLLLTPPRYFGQEIAQCRGIVRVLSSVAHLCPESISVRWAPTAPALFFTILQMAFGYWPSGNPHPQFDRDLDLAHLLRAGSGRWGQSRQQVDQTELEAKYRALERGDLVGRAQCRDSAKAKISRNSSAVRGRPCSSYDWSARPVSPLEISPTERGPFHGSDSANVWSSNTSCEESGQFCNQVMSGGKGCQRARTHHPDFGCYYHPRLEK